MLTSFNLTISFFLSRQKYHNHGCRPEAVIATTIVASSEEEAVMLAAALWLVPSMEKLGQTRVGHMQLHSHIGVLNLDQ